MKYLTKEWYRLLGRQRLADDLHDPDDDLLRNSSFEDLYDICLKEEIERDQKYYNTPPEKPDASILEELSDLDDADLELLHMLHEEPVMPETLTKMLSDIYEEEMEAFNSRKPYDPRNTAASFREMYEARLETLDCVYPEWLVQEADHRLLALGYVTRSQYDRLCAEDEQVDAQLQEADRKIDEMLFRQLETIPHDLLESFDFNGADILSLRGGRNNDLEIIMVRDGFPDECAFETVIFRHARILENEVHVRLRPVGDGTFDTDCRFLQHELYRLPDDRYEVHMMMEQGDDLQYLTLQCYDIDFRSEQSALRKGELC